jgi:excisionase family DNA binding protein
MKNDGLDPLLTIDEVATMLRLSTKTVRRLRIPCVRLGRAIRFRPSDVERFLAGRKFHA